MYGAAVTWSCQIVHVVSLCIHKLKPCEPNGCSKEGGLQIPSPQGGALFGHENGNTITDECCLVSDNKLQVNKTDNRITIICQDISVLIYTLCTKYVEN